MCLAEHLANNISYQQKQDFIEVKVVLRLFSMGSVFHLFTSELFIVCIMSDNNFPFSRCGEKRVSDYGR